MNETVKTKPNVVNPCRIVLTGEGSDRVNRWMNQLQQQFHGLRMNRNELVEWLILAQPLDLSLEEIREIGGKYYDELDLANWALRQLKEARSKGQNISLENILKSLKTKG